MDFFKNTFYILKDWSSWILTFGGLFKNKKAKLVRVPKFSEIPYPTIMEPSLVIEYYSR